MLTDVVSFFALPLKQNTYRFSYDGTRILQEHTPKMVRPELPSLGSLSSHPLFPFEERVEN